MMILLAVAGALWGGWLGRREAAHVGVGIGLYGLVGGTVLGTAIGFGLGFVAWWIAVIAALALAAATAVIVRRW